MKVKIIAPAHGAIIRTTLGYSCALEPNEERMVPPYVAEYAIRAGCSVLQGGHETARVAEVQSAEERAAAVDAAVRVVLEANKKGDIKNGIPTRRAVETALGGGTVTVAEIEASLARLAAQANAGEGAGEAPNGSNGDQDS
jgi:hypothetical protein